MDTRNDEQLMAAIMMGEENALTTLVVRYHKPLFAYVAWVTFLVSLNALSQSTSNSLVVLNAQGEMVFGCIGVLLVIGSFRRIQHAWPDLLNKSS